EAKGTWSDAHLTVMGDDALNGFADTVWAFHAGGKVNLDQFAVTAALAGNSDEYYDGLLSAQGTFDLFTIAASTEFATIGAGNSSNGTGSDLCGLGFGGSVGVQATDAVAINLGARYWDYDSDNAIAPDTEIWQVALGATFDVTESISLNGAVGYKGAGAAAGIPDDGTFYGELGVDYAPGGGFTTGADLEINGYGAYKVA